MPLDYRIIAEAIVDSARVTGKARHYRDGALLEPPARLVIAQLGTGSGYYLLYLSDSGIELTDTWHESIEDAVQQAQYEFGLSHADWRWVT